MPFFKDLWKKLKNAWNSIWDGATIIQQNATEIIKGVEAVKKVTEHDLTDTVTAAIPGGIDDAIVKYLNRAANKVLPVMRDADKFNDCVLKHDDDEEKIDCIAQTLKKVTEEDRYDFYLNVAAEAIKELIKDSSPDNKEISEERAKRIAQGSYDAKKLAEDLKE